MKNYIYIIDYTFDRIFVILSSCWIKHSNSKLILGHTIILSHSTHDYRKISNYSAKKNNSEPCLALPLEHLKLFKVPVFISLTVLWRYNINRTTITLSNAKINGHKSGAVILRYCTVTEQTLLVTLWSRQVWYRNRSRVSLVLEQRVPCDQNTS